MLTMTRRDLAILITEAEQDIDKKIATTPGYGDALKHQQEIIFLIGALCGVLSFVYTQGDDAEDQETREISHTAELAVNRLRRKYNPYWA